ncbi:MAG: hypothetical protein ABSC46_13650 [Candidatus Limnocylindrales bacterium]
MGVGVGVGVGVESGFWQGSMEPFQVWLPRPSPPTTTTFAVCDDVEGLRNFVRLNVVPKLSFESVVSSTPSIVMVTEFL